MTKVLGNYFFYRENRDWSILCAQPEYFISENGHSDYGQVLMLPSNITKFQESTSTHCLFSVQTVLRSKAPFKNPDSISSSSLSILSGIVLFW